MSESTFQISGKASTKAFITLGVGIVLLVIGTLGLSMGWWGTRGEHHGGETEIAADHSAAGHDKHESEAHEGHDENESGTVSVTPSANVNDEDHQAAVTEVDAHDTGHHNDYHWSKRIKMNFWLNCVIFAGIAIIGVFFYAIQFVAWVGWSAILSRVLLAFGYWLIPAAILMLIGYFAFSHDIFHWTHEGITDKDSPHYDAIIAGKSSYLNPVFFIVRMVLYFALWFMFWVFMKNQADKEDLDGGERPFRKTIQIAAGFLVVFAVTSSTSAWDWVLSIDTHWFSTMFGWYVFASWFVTGLCVITLVVINLKKYGYLPQVNANHLHNLGLFMFAFSVFWTYIWFSQFILIWYANIPEESVKYVEMLMMNDGEYLPMFILNIVINFLFPFLFLMTRDAKRQTVLLQVAAYALIGGHWIDFYLMMMPPTLHENGGLDLGTLFVELGMTLVFAGLFVYTLMFGLSQRPVLAKNHPLLEESLHHTY